MKNKSQFKPEWYLLPVVRPQLSFRDNEEHLFFKEIFLIMENLFLMSIFFEPHEN